MNWREDLERVIEASNKYLSRMYRRYYPLIPDRAFDDVIYSIDGTAYVDLYGGISIANVGWSNPKVVKAVEGQLGRFFHMPSVYYLGHAARLAKKLAELSPGGRLTKCYFLNSGSEAVETAIAISKRAKKRPYIISLHRSFHGKTYYAVSLTGQANWKPDAYPLAPVAFAPDPYCYRCPLGHSEYPECGLACANYIEDIIKCEIGNSASAFIAEPMLANGGMIVPPKEYFKEVKKILDRHSILLIADEVQSGNGRSGRLWAIEHYDVIPDIMTASKALANGIPISAVMYREELDQFLTPGEHYSTFGCNALACVAAEVVLEELTNGLIKEAAEKGEYFIKRLNELKDKHGIVGDVRGMGLFIGIELVKDRATKTPAREEAFSFIQEAWKRRVLVGVGGLEGNVIRIEPPLTIKREHIDYAVEVFDSVLRNMK